MRKVIITLSTLLLATGLRAQQPLKLSLNECIDYAVKNSYTMKDARLNILIQEQQVKQTSSNAYPHINQKADLVHFNKPQYSFFDASAFNPSVPAGTIAPLPFTIPYTTSGSISAGQVLFDGSLLVALQARNTIMDMARLGENITAENIKMGVYVTYNSLVVARKQYDLIGNLLVYSRKMEHDLQAMRDNGLSEKIDVDRMSVQVTNLAADSIRVLNALTSSEQLLKFQMGMNINTPISLVDTNVEKLTTDALGLMAGKEDMESLPEFRSLTIALKLNEYDLKRYKLAALPTLSGFYSVGVNYGGAKFGDMWKLDQYKNYSNMGLSLSTPLFNGFVRQHQVTQAKLTMERTRNNMDAFKLNYDYQVASARTNLRNSLLQVQSLKRNLELSMSVLDLAQKKYAAGVGANTEVSVAQTDLLSAQNNYFSVLLNVISAEASLKKSLGMFK